MNKKMREILAKMDSKRALAKECMQDGENKDLERAESLLNEAEQLQKEFNLEKRLYEAEKNNNTPTEGELEKKAKEGKSKDSVKEFAEAARKGFKVKSMNEGTPEDGGYAVPEDILTKIEKYRESKRSLRDLVTVQPVKTNKGSRTYKKR